MSQFTETQYQIVYHQFEGPVDKFDMRTALNALAALVKQQIDVGWLPAGAFVYLPSYGLAQTLVMDVP